MEGIKRDYILQYVVSSVGLLGATVRAPCGLQGPKVVAQQVPHQRLGWVLRHIRGQLYGQHCRSHSWPVLPQRGRRLPR